MKKLFLILFLLTGIVSAQTYATYVDTLANGSDTTQVVRLRASFPIVSVTIEEIGAAACTLSVNVMTFIKDDDGEIIDTTFAVPWIRDEEGMDVTTLIVASGETKGFLIMRPNMQGIELAVTSTASANVRTIIEVWRP